MAEEGHKVSLNVYDLSQGLARQLSMTFLGKAIEGIWHTGVVVYGNEYYFGAGVQHDPAGTTPYGTPIRTVDLGVTHIPKDVFEEYLQEISPRYTAETYSLLTHNCNNFSNEVALFLVGATIPEYILNLPKDVMGSPMGPLILPMIQNLETTLKSGAVPGASRFNPVTQLQTRNPTSTVNKNLPNGCEVNPKKAEEQCGKDVEQKSKGNVAPAVKSTANGVAGDPLGDSRNKVQEEISAEFASLMASGTLKASEAAAMAARKVMERYGHIDVAQS